MQDQVNQLILERDNYQNDLTLMTIAFNSEQEERRRWWGIVQKMETGMQTHINILLLDKFALNFKFRRCQRHGRELQQKYDIQGHL